MRPQLFSLALALLCVITKAQTKVYKLVDKTENADINLQKINQLNNSGAGYQLLNKVFKPKQGQFKVYRFISTYKGISHNSEKQEIFHDLIILKTDKQNKIIDGYQYTLEWAEVPFYYDLYRIKNKKKNLMTTSILNS